VVKKNRSPHVGDLRDAKGISTETHHQMFDRLVAALTKGMHNHPGPRKPKKG